MCGETRVFVPSHPCIVYSPCNELIAVERDGRDSSEQATCRILFRDDGLGGGSGIAETIYRRCTLQEIHNMLKENNKVLKCSNASPDWRGYVDFVNNVVVDGMSRVICASLEYLLDQVRLRCSAGCVSSASSSSAALQSLHEVAHIPCRSTRNRTITTSFHM